MLQYKADTREQINLDHSKGVRQITGIGWCPTIRGTGRRDKTTRWNL